VLVYVEVKFALGTWSDRDQNPRCLITAKLFGKVNAGTMFLLLPL